MIISLYLNFIGYVRVIVSGCNAGRFITLCTNKDFYIWNLTACECTDQGIPVYEFNIAVRDFFRIKSLLVKTGTRVHIKERHGIRFIIYRYRHRKCFLLGAIMAWTLIYLSTLFIWDINVSGESAYTNSQLIKEIKENYVTAGTLKKNVDCAELEKTLRNEYDKIAWISCDITGTQLNIVFTETVETDKIEQPDEPCDIIAAKDAVIYEIVTRSGTPVVHAKQEVKKGDVLISGTIEILSDYDELMDLSFVYADGDVYGIVEYEYYDEFNMTTNEKIYTGEKKKYYSISVMDNIFTPYKPGISYENYDIVTEQNKLKLGRTFYLPISVNKSSINEYTVNLVTYTEEEAYEKAEKRLTQYLTNLKEKKVEILENNVTINIDGDVCTVSGTITALEPVGVPSEINIEEKKAEYIDKTSENNAD